MSFFLTVLSTRLPVTTNPEKAPVVNITKWKSEDAEDGMERHKVSLSLLSHHFSLENRRFLSKIESFQVEKRAIHLFDVMLPAWIQVSKITRHKCW